MSHGLFYAEDDGVDHIRMHDKAMTRLGRYLANSALTPFRHPKFGSFQSLEGFWHYLGTGCKIEAFRKLSGRGALLLGGMTPHQHSESFHENILAALKCKIEQSNSLLDMLEQNDLPFALYELDQTGSTITHHDWFVTGLGKIIKERPWLIRPPKQPTEQQNIRKRVRWTETAVS